MTADPAPPPTPDDSRPELPWEATLAGVEGERSRGPLTAPSRAAGRARHAMADIDEEFRPQADWRLNAWLAGALAGIAAVLVGTMWVVQAVPHSPGPAVQADVDAPRIEAAKPAVDDAVAGRNIVFVLTDGAGATVAAAVMGADEERATCVLTPRRLVLDVRGGGPTPLSSVFAASDTRGAAAVEDTLGVRVDGAWRLSTKGLVRLVDSVGGVRVDRDVQVGTDGDIQERDEPGQPPLLAGDAAAQFAMKAPRGAAEVQRLARFYAVLDGVLHALPDDARARHDKLMGLGGETRSTLPADQFFNLVGDLHRHARAEDMDDQLLPIVPASRGRPGGYDVDAAKFKRLLDGPLAHVRRPVKVLVQADGESPQAADEVRSLLEAARLSYVPGVSTQHTPVSSGARRTTVTALSRSPGDLARARQVAEALGVSASAIEMQDVENPAYDVIVKLGSDLEQLLRFAGLTPAAAPT